MMQTRSRGCALPLLAQAARSAQRFYANRWDVENPAAFLYEVDGKIVGLGTVSHNQGYPSGKNPSGIIAFIQDLVVDPEFRSVDFASTSLLLHLEDLIRFSQPRHEFADGPIPEPEAFLTSW